jgi:hypothetical protein
VFLELRMTDLELYNITLSLFDRVITQEDLDSATPSKEVRLCKLYKPLAILRVLREFDWSFLVVELQIDYGDDSPGRGFLHGYKLPAGLLKVVHAFSDFAYEVAGGRIYTDVDEAVVYGIMEDLPEADVPTDFYELIAYALAYQIAPLLAPEGRVDQVTLQKYTWALNGLISAECHNNMREA